jgi:transposase
MKQIKFFVGTDVSKEWLDMCILSREAGVLEHQRIANKVSVIRKWIAQSQKLHGYKMEDTLFAMEFTGIYNNHLLSVLHELQAAVWLIPGIVIAQKDGLQRGKSDKQDARRIGEYAMENQKKVRVWNKPRAVLEQLQALLMIREKLMLSKHQYATTLKEYKEYGTAPAYKTVKQFSETMLKKIEEELQKIEKQIMQVIHSDEKLSELSGYITSVEGVGMITAANMLVTTNEFVSIKEAKKYCCYAGVAPFKEESGKKIKKPRVSHKANKKMKKLFHLVAMSAVRMKGEIKAFYERKLAEGKNKMSVINAIRNKIILRIFACVHNKKLYEKNYTYSLDKP